MTALQRTHAIIDFGRIRSRDRARFKLRSSRSHLSRLDVESLESRTLLSTITGQKFEDHNGDGIQDPQDLGLPGWTIFIDSDQDGVLDFGEPTALTDTNGNYTFSGLTAGQYRIRESLQAGWIQTAAGSAAGNNSIATDETWRAIGPVGNLAGAPLNSVGLTWESSHPGWNTNVNFDDSDAAGWKQPVFDAPRGPNFIWVDGDGSNGSTPAYFRKVFNVGDSPTGTMNLEVDDDVLVYINGQLVLDDQDHSASIFNAIDVTSALQSGQNLIAAKAHDSFGLFETLKIELSIQSDAITDSHLVTLGANQTVAGINFGNFKLMTLGGEVFHDQDGDHLKNLAEPRLADWTIYIDSNDNGNFDQGEVSTTSNTDGSYAINGVGPGIHHVREVLQQGWVQSFPQLPDQYTVLGSSGGAIASLDFGNFVGSTIQGLVFEDQTGNGQFDGQDHGIAGRSVYLDANDNGTRDAAEAAAIADSGGNYTFSSLAPATYRVRQIVPSGWVETLPVSSYVLNLSSGQNSLNVNFGSFRQFSVTGQVYEDRDGNGVKDATDQPLNGVTIYLDADNDGVFDLGELAATSNALGNYVLAPIGPGQNRLRELVPTAWVQTAAASGYTINGQSGQSVVGRDFGNFEPVTIGGIVFEDMDGDGARDLADTGLANWLVFLDVNSNGVPDEGDVVDHTDLDGSYAFVQVGPGTRSVGAASEPGWMRTQPAGVVMVNPVSGENSTAYDFGYYEPFRVVGQIFEDSDGDGFKDASEASLQGRVVYLDSNDNAILDAGERSSISDPSGNYLLDQLGPGPNRIRQVGLAGWIQTTPLQGHVVSSVSGQQSSGWDFGDFERITISGRVFEDHDGTGLEDAQDKAVSGWTVFVDRNFNGTLDGADLTTTTNSFGDYSFIQLGPGQYRVRAVIPSGWQLTSASTSFQITSLSGDNAANRDFAVFHRLLIGGTVFDDRDGDGIKDAEDLGLSGWMVFLDRNANGSLDSTEPRTTSDASGDYLLVQTGPGTYRVRAIAAVGWNSTIDLPARTGESGQSVGDLDLGFFSAIVLSGQQFEDRDGDGEKDADDPALAGWTIFIDDNGDGTFNAGEPNTVSDTAGNFRFATLRPGTYQIRQVLQTNWWPTTVIGGYSVTLTSGANAAGYRFGDFAGMVVRGQRFEDGDADGFKSGTETGVAGFTIYLDSDGNGVLGPGEPSTVTDVDGDYSFVNLAPGTYSLRSVPQPGWTDSSSSTYPIVGRSGLQVDGLNFAGFRPASVGGRAFEDSDADGRMDAGERAIAAVAVFVDSNADRLLNNPHSGNGICDAFAVERCAVTDAAGRYGFSDVRPGLYSIYQVIGPGWAQTAPGSGIGAVSGQGYVTETRSGDVLESLDFGVRNLPPTVEKIDLILGLRNQLSRIAITFSEATSDAGNMSHYSLTAKKGRRPKPVPLRLVAYDSVTHVASLTPRGKIKLATLANYTITVRSSPLLIDESSNAFDGDHDTYPGGDFVGNLATVSRPSI